MQASTQPQTPAAAPQAPATDLPQPVITTVGPGGETQTLAIPKTRSEVQSLLSQREELSDQLISVTSRRRELSAEIAAAPEGASRAGLEDRIRILDQRIVQLETDMALTGRQLALAPASLTASTQVSSSDDDWEAFLEVVGGTTLFVLPVVILVALWRRRRRKKRGATPAAPAQLQGESNQRLERLEQGMEAIAVEIERISEGQRFVTKLLAESRTPVGHREGV